MISLFAERFSSLRPWVSFRGLRSHALSVPAIETFPVASVVNFVARTARRYPTKKWAVLGKGPSSDRYADIDWDDFHVISLNHAIRLGPALLAHFVDMEAFWDNVDHLRPGQFVVMPWRPHVQMKPTEKTLKGWTCEPGPLRDAWLEGRLLSYNATCHRKFPAHADLPSVSLRYFSAEAGFNILAGAGIKTIHTLGVDGGTGYGAAFDPKDHLANGLASFDQQLEEIARTCQTLKIRHVRLGSQSNAVAPALQQAA